MKKITLILLQLLLTLNVFAQTYKYTSTNLNLRSGPGTSYQVLTTIPLGTSVEMAENCDCDWIKVAYDDKATNTAFASLLLCNVVYGQFCVPQHSGHSSV